MRAFVVSLPDLSFTCSGSRLYHTRLVIPGQRFNSFLDEIVAFLSNNPTEIVVVRTCSDGIQQCAIPTTDVITQYAQSALGTSGINLGDSAAFQTSISSLRSSNTRLILVQDDPTYNSYSNAAYATLKPSKIIAAFENMTAAGQAGKDMTVLQCQVGLLYLSTTIESC